MLAEKGVDPDDIVSAIKKEKVEGNIIDTDTEIEEDSTKKDNKQQISTKVRNSEETDSDSEIESYANHIEIRNILTEDYKQTLKNVRSFINKNKPILKNDHEHLSHHNNNGNDVNPNHQGMNNVINIKLDTNGQNQLLNKKRKYE